MKQNDDGGEDSDEEDSHVVSTHEPCVEPGACTEIESSFKDQSEQMKVDHFLAKSCGCKLGLQGAACSSVVSKQVIVRARNNCLQMTNHELDLVIVAQINAQRTRAADRLCTYRGKGDFRPSMKFFFHGIQICQNLFCSFTPLQECALGIFVHLSVSMGSRIGCMAMQERCLTMHAHGLPLPGCFPNCKQVIL